ncbi:interleukin-27 receptor subunit alpha [Elgaria multicarinata webbii]|uniref:interleukin-27 receptor subunit alpha n=1 Tax=Elgaria multicarinata webbii TaxID=159646 RepID=UPI002FCD2649
MGGKTGTLRCRWNVACLLLLALKTSGLKEGDPDTPMGLQCYLSVPDISMNCSWSTRDPPDVSSISVLHYESLKLRPNQTHLLKAQNKANWLLIGQDTVMQGDDCSVWVEVHTAAGTATSNKLNFSLYEIVKPPPPVLDSVEPDSHGGDVKWETEPPSHQCLIYSLQYKASKDHGWIYVHEDHVGHSSHYLEGLKPFTLYEVQARCRPEKGFWSEWSSSQHFQTLEAAPLGRVDVWQKVDVSDNQKRLLLWKALDPESAQGKILDYEVYYQNQGGSVLRKTCPCCRTNLPHTANYAWVSARNSVGNTQLANLSLVHAVLPGPEKVQVLAVQDLGLNVTWKPSTSPLWVQPEEYVVEWREELRSKGETLNWSRGPGSSDSVLLRGNFTPTVPYLVYVYAVHAHGYSASDPVRAYFKEEAPSNSPQALQDQSTSSTVSLITWEEIPLVDRNGHITHYTLYLQQLASRTFEANKTIGAPKRSHKLSGLTPGTSYQLWITGSTSSGEGRPSPLHHFRTPDSSWLHIVVVLLLVGCLLIVALVVALVKRRWVRGFCHKILPPCCWEEIPDPGHSIVVLKINEQSCEPSTAPGMNALSQDPTLSPEGMDIVEIKEPAPEPAPQPTAPPPPVEISGYEKRFMPTPEELQNLV